MIYISNNIRYLLDKSGESEKAFGEIFGLKRGSISSYIHGDVHPKIETLQKISAHFNVSIDDLINKDISLTNNYIQKNDPLVINDYGCKKCESLTLMISYLEKTIENYKAEMYEAREEIGRLKHLLESSMGKTG